MQVLTFDFVILIIGVIVISLIKSKYPSIFFLAEGVNIFLAPEQLPEPEAGKRRRSKKQTEDAPLKIIEAKLQTLKKYPLYNQYEKLFMLTLLMLIHWIVTIVLRNLQGIPEFFKKTSSLPYYLTILLLIYAFIYAWKVATHNGLKSLQLKASAVATFLVFGLYWAVQTFFTTQTTISLKEGTQALNHHLSIMFVGSQIQISQSLVLGLILVIGGFLVFVTVPSIIKYGSIYTQLLKQAYLQESDASYPQEMKVAKANVKLHSKKQLKILNVELTLGMVLIVCWGVPPVREQIPDFIFTSGLICLTMLLSYVPLVTFKEQIQLTMHGAYIHIKSYLNAEEKTQQLLKSTQLRVYSYIHLFWYHSYQLLFKIAVPVLLLILAFQSIKVSPPYELVKTHYEIAPAHGLTPVKVNLDTSCGLVKDPLLAIKHIYHCSRSIPLGEVKSSINGWQLSNQDSSFESSLKKITEYGLMPFQFLSEFWSQILWYYIVSKYLLTIFYIVFLRKTVLEI